MQEKLEITKSSSASGALLTLSGRIDSYWSNELTTVLTEEIHAGQYHIALDMAGVRFISSAGLRVLIQFYRELGALNGSLTVEQPSAHVVSVLRMAGLVHLMTRVETQEKEDTQEVVSKTLRFGNVMCSLRPLQQACLKGTVTGDPVALHGTGYSEKDCHVERYPVNRFGLGLGAIGQGFQDCRDRFGEYLAIAGAAAYLPTDGTNHPDYVLQAGSLIPELTVLYGLSFEGDFSHLLRFEAAEGRTGVTLSELMQAASEAVNADTLGIVMMAEATGLVGAALTKSPFSLATGSSPFAFPEIRDCLNFTTERAYSRSLILAAGVLTREADGPLANLTRSMSGNGGLMGHFHAAAFPYRPLKKGLEELSEIVKTLFETGQIQAVLHLANDDREIIGVGQSELSRGICWISPVFQIVHTK
ncbi:MAG: anti-sigma factor antagonist [Acidobacteria bacterium]|nr:MAG: anti-sigma factor antagonist [Acidobacteriota bacterium]